VANQLGEATKEKPLAEKMEIAMSNEVMQEGNVQYMISEIHRQYGFKDELYIMPHVDDKTLLVVEWGLVSAGQVIVAADDYEQLLDGLNEVILSRDTALRERFIKKLATVKSVSA
jgi:hypothetical protein